MSSFIYNSESDHWNLAPAYDLTYPLDALKNYKRVSRALSINGKRINITRNDVLEIAKLFTMSNANTIVDEVIFATQQFRKIAVTHDIPTKVIDKIESQFIVI